MIARIRGILAQLEGQTAYVDVGPLWYEVLLPTNVVPRLPAIGGEVTLFLHAYIEGGQMSSAMHQRLIGFLDQVEREFYELLLTVAGLGAKKAARAMALSVSHIASAIERADERTLRGLPEIGPSTAKKIIAHLQGKAGKFALLRDTSLAAAPPAASAGEGAVPPAAARAPAGTAGDASPQHELLDDAHKVLTDLLHYTPREASEMIHRALEIRPQPASSDELLQTIFQLSGQSR